MKRAAMIASMLILVSVIVLGCGGQATPAQKFTEEDGALTYTDLEHGPFENYGLKIIVTQGENGSVRFVLTGMDGAETRDYFLFDNATTTAEKHAYVSAMGTSYYYTFDFVTHELVKVESGDNREDVTESLKNAGRWDNAAATVANEVHHLEDYFSEQYDISLWNAMTDDDFGK